MNRMAILCAVALVVLTLAAYIHDRQGREDDGANAWAASTPAAVTPAAAPTGGPPTVTETPRLADAVVRERIETQVIEPLRETELKLSSFSRALIRPAEIEYELDTEEDVKPDADEQPVFVRFRVFKKGGRSGPKRLRKQIAAGRMDRATGRIELAMGGDAKVPESAYQELPMALRSFGVSTKKRPW